MASRALTTIYSKLLSRITVRSLCTFAPSDSNFESDNSGSRSRSKQLPHSEGKKIGTFNQFLKEGPAFPCKVMKDEKYERLNMLGTPWVADKSLHAKAVEEVDDDPPSAEQYRRSYYDHIDVSQSRYKMGNIVTEFKNVVFNMKPQMMMRNTCNSRRWFTSLTDAVSDATNVESNAFSANEAGHAVNGKGPGILHRMVCAVYIKEGKFPNIDNLIASSVSFIKKEGELNNFNNFIDMCEIQHRFFVKKHNIRLENYGLYKKGYTDWHAAGISKSRYISIDYFMWWLFWFPKKYVKSIYNYMFKQQIYVLESCPVNLLRDNIIPCFWDAPPDEWYKLNVSGFFKENLDGTKEASCGEVVRDCRGKILEIFHKPLPDATSRDEVFLLGVYHGINGILQWRSEAKKIILEIDHKKIVKVLNHEKDIPLQCLELYRKIFNMLLKFDEYDASFQHPQGNAVANRVAYVASHLTVGQSFPIGDRSFETQVRCNRLNIPRHEIFPKERIEVEESSDDE